MNEPLSEVIRIRATPSHAARLPTDQPLHLDHAYTTCQSGWIGWKVRGWRMILVGYTMGRLTMAPP
ncbi:hypothetical protein [Castellaniella sp.]|uniref:hypothetical protein n=1 Tax=Castellaniella sp. TaxID=1955812 RepID=UPI002AFF5FFA|nr:hypothetical protein [Castellaniella sp.]